MRPRSRPKETKIILGRWGRDEGQGRGGGSAGGGAQVPDTLLRLGLFVPGLSLAEVPGERRRRRARRTAWLN